MTRRSVLLEAGLAALFGLGVLHWLYVFGFLTPGFPGMSFTVADWPKEVRYYVALQQALVDGRIPYYVSRSIQETRKFLANPEVPWSPDLLLLRFVGIEVFLVLKVLLWYAAGFCGLLLIRRRYALDLLPFTFLFLLFAANGHIVAHLAIGHSMWTGYFLLPFVFVHLMDILEDGSRTAPLKLAFVFFLMLLQGSLHVFAWCVLLVVLAAAFRRRALKPLAVALAWTAALGALPAPARRGRALREDGAGVHLRIPERGRPPGRARERPPHHLSAPGRPLRHAQLVGVRRLPGRGGPGLAAVVRDRAGLHAPATTAGSRPWRDRSPSWPSSRSTTSTRRSTVWGCRS